MEVCQTVLDAAAESRRKNVEGQLDLFGLAGEEESSPRPALHLPEVPEYSRRELMTMEREVTGLYLSGHPMDEYRRAVRTLKELSPEYAYIQEGGTISESFIPEW